MPAEISIGAVKPRPLAVVRLTTVLSKWPRQFLGWQLKVRVTGRNQSAKQVIL
jgi:hypothetical protein